jgi:hypothetical protein
VALAERAAEKFWGNTPCDGQIAVSWQQITPSPAQPGTEVEAWVTFQTPLGELDFAAAPSTYTACTVYISMNVWPTYASTIAAYPQFCQMMIHEFGHFQGYADSMSYPPSDIRYPLLTDTNLPALCASELHLNEAEQPSDSPPPSTALTGRDSRTLARRMRTHCFEVKCGLTARRLRPKRR